MATKIVIGALIVLGVLFYVLMFAGSSSEASKPLPPANDEQARIRFAEENRPPRWIGGLIGSLSPKLDLAQREFRFSQFELQVEVQKGDSQFRKAVFRVTKGCRSATDCSNVVIHYVSKDGEGSDMKLDTQSWRPFNDTPTEASLVILKGGGTLHFQCVLTPSCTATLL